MPSAARLACAITITLPIQKPGAPDTLLRMRSAPLGMRIMRRRASFISAPVVFTHSCRMASARGSVSIGTPNAFATQSADVTVGRPDTAGGEDIGVAMPERIECIDDRSLLIADHSHFLEIDADRGQILRDIADVLVLGAAGQDLTTNHQERGRDNLFGSGRVDGWHDHLRVSAELLEFDRLINNWHRRFFWPLHSSRSLPSRAPEVAPWPDASAAVRMVVRRISLAQACLPAQAPARAQCFGRRMIG